MVALARMRTSGTIRFGGYRRRAERRRRYEPKGTAPRRGQADGEDGPYPRNAGVRDRPRPDEKYVMEFGNLRIEICADAACIAVRVVLAHGTGSSVKYFDPDTLQENFKAIDKHREDEDRAIISDWVNLNGPEYCRKQVEAIWKQGG